ncbi:unnamed protein product [Spodoptera littoralis]|uniref:Uncharacterized protein n=1 Tax=Spodoptera littoralis TaxID=7109 RepID=A0A9P0I6V3_SPOLI|nr:unnamed protein product [Spodoptera littoralis]CAH1642173.1 unnamed protein product [Spodoptera littoralis]
MAPPKDNKQGQDSQNKQAEPTPEGSGTGRNSRSPTAGPSGRTTPRSGTTNASTTPTTTSSAEAGPSTARGEIPRSPPNQNTTSGSPPERQTSTVTLTRVTLPRRASNQSIASEPYIDPGPSRDVASIAGSSVYSAELEAYSNSVASGFPSRQTGTSRYVSTNQNTGSSNDPAFSSRSVSQLEYAQRRQADLSRGRFQFDEGSSARASDTNQNRIAALHPPPLT